MRILYAVVFLLLASWAVDADEIEGFYQFNQLEWTGSDSVLDSSDKNNHGSPIGDVSPVSYSAGSCRLLNVPRNTSSSEQDAVDTQVDLNQVGNDGSIAFWYRSNLSWSNSTKRQLLDASNQAPSQDKYFYLSLGGGTLQFGIEDDNDYDITAERTGLSYAADEWVHITVTWDLSNKRIQIYEISGGSGTVLTRSDSSLRNFLGDMDTLYIGDNRSNYIVNQGTGNSANGQFEDVYIYDFKLSNSQVLSLASTEPDCEELDAVLVSHWPMDVCSLDGTSGEVIDIVAGKNGTAIDGANIDINGKLCQASEYAGNGEHINIPHDANFELSDGSIAMWFRLDDLDPPSNSYFNGRALFSKDSTGFDSGGGHLTIYVGSNGAIKARHQSTSNNYNLSSSANLISENQWHHLVYTFGSSGIKIYIDKQLVATNTYTGGIGGNPEPIILGAGASHTGDNESAPDDLKDYFMGEIDDVRLYQGQLSQEEVDNLFTESESVCITCETDILVAQYQFEQSEWLGANTVTDSSSNGYHATALGAAIPINPSEQVACRAMEIPASASLDSQFNGIDTGIDVNVIGNKGSISFWYRSNEAWNSGNSRQLFDASTDVGGDVGNSRFFYFAILSGGQLDFKLEDENDLNFGAQTKLSLSYAADTWVHVAVTYDLESKTSAIYLDGVKQSVSITAQSGLSTEIGDFDTLYIGDNRSAYLSNGSTQNSANGEFDEVRIYNYVQTSTEVNFDKDALSTCSFVYKYLIDHDGNGLTCDPEPVTIKACANESCSELYDQDITVKVSPNTGWPDGETVTILADTPASLTLSKPDPGTVTLDVVDENVECTGVSGGSCDLTFSDAGFQFIGASKTDTFPDQIAESNFTSAQLRAIQTDDSSGSNQCVAALVGAQDLTFNLSCDDPSSCLTPVQTGSGTINSGSDATVSLTFDSNGYASLGAFSYADAGQISLSVQSEIDDATYLSGSTQFVVYPDRIDIQSTSTTSLSRAGGEFGLEVTARGSENGILPNYQPQQIELWLQRALPTSISGDSGVLTYAQSGTIVASETGSFKSSVISASNTNIASSNGVYSFTADYAEYGTVNLDIRDADYFGHTIGSTSAGGGSPITLGLFIPAYFDVNANSPQLADNCAVTSGFTYLGQNTAFATPPQFVVTAMNAKGNITTHYQLDSLWSWLGSSSEDYIIMSDSGHVGSINFYGSLDMDVTDQGVAGSRALTINNAYINYSKSTTPYGPFSASLEMNILPSFFTDSTYASAPVCYHQSYDINDDCDAVSSVGALDDTNNMLNLVAIGGTEYRWGRIVIDNGFGPETENILLPVSTEYFNGTDFIQNTDDTCTLLTLTASDFSITDTSGGSTSAISILTSDFGMTSGKTLGFEGIAVENADISVMGEYRIELLPVGDSSITWDDFLQYDWNGSESGIGNPSAIVSFGQFRGNDRIIYWRETGN
ncbi:LamG domain-containing protein [Aliiglaciecola lipolytica]|uniref:LamG domain-containing protein n=1 Tax=Aliiglaciecola lipolytica TaxID=477689 RepID=UPI001C07FC6F|nr:LamG domain-containing protein [Aliiglaciecola lipolytica]MBU2880199.1 LamG domain-containing protein [Aliiglaciecola lipolytica]